ncbi:hypothetical protein CHARACLAT_001767 [Characodon lateralis]|uniref:Uncharacterized protein n=1 Tax=Characodon lateralis TaxID=208331 RepID=A0ABU7DWV9_9TELE|nr:hypothetical protein [Characodon lateralis]
MQFLGKEKGKRSLFFPYNPLTCSRVNIVYVVRRCHPSHWRISALTCYVQAQRTTAEATSFKVVFTGSYFWKIKCLQTDCYSVEHFKISAVKLQLLPPPTLCRAVAPQTIREIMCYISP